MNQTSEPTPKALPFGLSRRTALLGGASVAVVAGAYFARRFLEPNGLAHAVMDVVRRLFGADIAAETELRAFADFYIRSRWVRRTFVRAYASAPVVFDIVRWAGLGGLASEIDAVDQSIGTAFLRNTNMLYRELGEPIVFAEEPPVTFLACRNRLARFDFDD